MEYSIRVVSGPDKSSPRTGKLGPSVWGLNACRPNGNSLAPKIVLSTIDGRSIFRGGLDGIAEEPKTALIPSRLGWRGDKERPYCSSTGPRLVSVITDRSLRGSPLMSALQQAAPLQHETRGSRGSSILDENDGGGRSRSISNQKFAIESLV